MHQRTVLSFDDWLGLLKKKLPQLGCAKSLAFAASCCERSLPNYEAFSSEQRWGNPEILREALDIVWRLITESTPAELKSHSIRLLKALKAVTPDTENFKSNLTSAALDAATSVAEALDYVREGTVDHIVTISSLAQDTIYLFVQYKENVNYSDNEFEKRITNHPLMVGELTKQQADVSTLESTHALLPEFLERFRQNATDGGRSSLGISRFPRLGNPMSRVDGRTRL